MSISKEERERLRELKRQADMFGPSLSADRLYIAEMNRWLPVCLDALDERDARLADCERILDGVSEVYLEITGGKISKPNTDPAVVLDYAREESE